MAEDMTYTPVQTLADARQRIAELERENAELRARLDAVPDYATYYYNFDGWEPVKSFDEWYTATPADDDTAATLTLATVEDGDE